MKSNFKSAEEARAISYASYDDVAKEEYKHLIEVINAEINAAAIRGMTHCRVTISPRFKNINNSIIEELQSLGYRCRIIQETLLVIIWRE